jgi:hypothetical protein
VHANILQPLRNVIDPLAREKLQIAFVIIQNLKSLQADTALTLGAPSADARHILSHQPLRPTLSW